MIEKITQSVNPVPDSVETPRIKHQNNFNFLRLLFATTVIVSHSVLMRDGDHHREPIDQLFKTGFTLGQVAVMGFFSLSGFLIVKSWMSQPQLWPFLKKRILRIYPGFVIASLFSEYVFGPLSGNPDYWADYSGWVVFAQADYVRIARRRKRIFKPTFYTCQCIFVVGPLRICLLSRRRAIGYLGLFRRRYLIVGLWAVFIALSLVQCTAQTMLFLPFWEGWLSSIMGAGVRPLGFFLAGACFYLFADKIRYTSRGVLLCSIVLFPCMFQYATGQAALLVCGSYILFASAFMKSPFMQGFGERADISYGVYLYAWPIGQLILNSNPTIDVYLLMMITTILSFVVGWLSWHLVEKPFLRLKPKPSLMQATIAEEPLILAEQADAITV